MFLVLRTVLVVQVQKPLTLFQPTFYSTFPSSLFRKKQLSNRGTPTLARGGKLAQTQHSCHQPQKTPAVAVTSIRAKEGSPFLCGRKRHKINVRHIHRTAPNRLQPI